MEHVDVPPAALAFARERHAGQTRRDGRTPYVTHPARVAKRLQDLGVDDAELLAAAVLHDTIEDTNTTRDELAQTFGERVADLVEEVSRRAGVTRRDFTERLETCSERAVLIRLADRLDNLVDQTGLEQHFLPVYAQEALRMLHHALRNPDLPKLDGRGRNAFLALAAQLVDAAASHLPHYKDPNRDTQATDVRPHRARRDRRR